MPLVSVVIPTHNRPEMLAETLASVRAQTFTDYEIVIVSNGESREMRGCSQAIATLHDAWWFALPKGNVSAARNFGIERAKGDWIAFLDDDDLWLPHKLERELAEMRRTGADMISCDYVEFYPDGREVLRQPRFIAGWPQLRSINHLLGWWTTPSGVIVRRALIEKVGGFDPRMRYCEDNDLSRRIAWRHRIHHMEEPLFRYRQGHPSLMQRQRLRYFYDICFFFKALFDTPRDLRSTLSDATFIWNRVMVICFPDWLAGELKLTAWGGAEWGQFRDRRLPWFRPEIWSRQVRQTIRHPKKCLAAFWRADD